MAALALVAIVFGVHSSIDWTWFVPAVAMTAMFAPAGSPAAARWARRWRPPPSAAPPLDQIHGPALPRRPALWFPAGRVVRGGRAPWRADQAGEDALELDAGNYAGARARQRLQGHQPAVVRALLRSGRDRHRCRQRQRRAQVVPARGPARACQPRHLAPARRLLRGQPGRPGPSRAGAPGRPLPRLSISSLPVRLMGDHSRKGGSDEVHAADPPGRPPRRPASDEWESLSEDEQKGGLRRLQGDQRDPRRHARPPAAGPGDGDHRARAGRQDADHRRPVRRDQGGDRRLPACSRPTTSTRRSSWPRGSRRPAWAARSRCARSWSGSDPRAGLPRPVGTASSLR